MIVRAPRDSNVRRNSSTVRVLRALPVRRDSGVFGCPGRIGIRVCTLRTGFSRAFAHGKGVRLLRVVVSGVCGVCRVCCFRDAESGSGCVCGGGVCRCDGGATLDMATVNQLADSVPDG